MSEKRKRNRKSRYLSDLGYDKIWQAIHEQFSDQRPTTEKITGHVSEKMGIESVSKDTISKIIRQKDKCDISKIESLFKAFNLNFSEAEDTTSYKQSLNNEERHKPYCSRSNLCRSLYQNLPPQHNKFIGRKIKLKELMEYLSEDYPQSIIQIDGIGGVGKTALALEAAYLCLEQRENCLSPELDLNYSVPDFGAIIWTSAKATQLLSPMGIGETLQAQRTLQEIYRAVAMTLEDPALLHGTDGRHLDNIINKLRKACKKNLLIIDNLETIENKRKIIDFVRKLHNTKVLITTREQAGIYSNICLDSLLENEGIELIKQQAKAAKISLSNQQEKDLYEASSGIPLAIIYSIGRLANLKCFNSERFEFVKSDLKNPNSELAYFCFQELINDFQENISYQLLTALSIFDQSSSLRALIEVAGLSSEPKYLIEEGLEKLQRTSLVRYENDYYRMLPITREYVLAQLEKQPDLKQAALNRWVNYYIDLPQQLYENQSKNEKFLNFYNILDNEWKNFLGVLRYCKDHNDYEKVKLLWSYLNNYSNIRGFWHDRLYWLSWLINHSKDRRKYEETIDFMARKGRILLLMGSQKDLESAQELLLEAWKLRKYANFKTLDYLTNHLAGLFIRLGHYQEAHKWLDEEQKNLDQQTQILSSDLKILHQIYIDRERAEILYYQKEFPKSKKLCQSVVAQSKKIQHCRNENYANKILADIAIKEKDFQKAKSLLEVGFKEVNLSKDKRRIAHYQVSLSLLEKEKGDLSKARDWIGQAMNNFKYIGMVRDFEKAKSIQKSLLGD